MSNKIQELSDMLKGGDVDALAHEGLDAKSPTDGPVDVDEAGRPEPKKDEDSAALFDMFDIDEVFEGFNLEQPNDSERDTNTAQYLSGRLPSHSKKADAAQRKFPRSASQSPGEGSDAPAELVHALRETMQALERSLATATEAALQHSFAIAEQVLQDHLAFPYKQRSRRRSSRHQAGSSSMSQTTSMKSIGEWPDMSARAAKLGAARRKSVTDKLWTDF